MLEDSFKNLVLPPNNHLGRKYELREAMLEDNFVNIDSPSHNHSRKCELKQKRIVKDSFENLDLDENFNNFGNLGLGAFSK